MFSISIVAFEYAREPKIKLSDSRQRRCQEHLLMEHRKTYVLVYRLHEVGLTAKEMFENFAVWYKVDVE